MIYRFSEFINEGLMNPNLIKNYIKNISSDIKRISDKIDIFQVSSSFKNYSVELSNLVESDIIHIESILSKWKKKLSNEEFIFTFFKNSSAPINKQIQYIIVFKRKYTRRVIPNRFVYHWSNVDEKTKDKILIEGLKPMPSSKSERWNSHLWAGLEYTPVIFAINNLDLPWGGKYLFRIDTNGLKNTWWESLNFEYSSGNAIMTYEPIPSSHITLIKDNYLKIREDEYEKISDEYEKIEKDIRKYIGKRSNNYMDADIKKLKKILDENKDFHKNGKKHKLGIGLGLNIGPIEYMIPVKIKSELKKLNK